MKQKHTRRIKGRLSSRDNSWYKFLKVKNSEIKRFMHDYGNNSSSSSPIDVTISPEPSCSTTKIPVLFIIGYNKHPNNNNFNHSERIQQLWVTRILKR